MLRVIACITDEHDIRLVILAGATALLGSHTALSLLRHASRSVGRSRRLWLGAAAVAAGSAIWATHFIGMLAFQPPVAVGYGLGLTALSLTMAVAMTAAGLWVAVRRPDRGMQAAGGAIIGLAVAAMHYTGMSALLFPGDLSWDTGLVAVSVGAGAAFSAMAVPLALRGGHWRRMAAAALLTCSICALHFTGMAAVSLNLTGASSAVMAALPPTELAGIVALACTMILLLSIVGLLLDQQNARRREVERLNLRDLADIAMEGLLVCDRNRVVVVNTSFAQMSGHPAATLAGTLVEALFEPSQPPADTAMEQASERVLLSAAGERIPVEVMQKPILYSGQPHRVMAVRDLRERRKAEADIRFLAHHDSLTGLSNRAAFSPVLDRQLLEQARHRKPFALFALDLDRFKEVNDTLGHQLGDLLLQRVAGRLRAATRELDVVARLGGDEFAILPGASMTPRRPPPWPAGSWKWCAGPTSWTARS